MRQQPGRRTYIKEAGSGGAEKPTAAGVNLALLTSGSRGRKGKFRIFILRFCHHPEVEGNKRGALLGAHAHETVVKAASAKHSSGMCCGGGK